ncbi:MAG: DUF5711 family protein [Bacteroides sp.]|nr:DUF5711 family protein [Bacteroides sp.]
MPEKESAGAKTSDLTEYRKKRKQKRLYKRLAVIGAVCAAALIIALNFSAIIEPLRGIASRIETKTSEDVGFPIKLPGSASYSFDSFGDSFFLLTDTYLYTFGTNGGQYYALRHGYSNPNRCSNTKRILLYDKDYGDFSLYNKTSLIYTASVEEKIVFASIGSGETAAIVTNSDRYSNIIYIYGGNGEWKYTRKFTDENVMNVEFSQDERYIYVSVIGVENGDIYSAVYKYDITAESEAVWSYKLAKPSLPVKMSAAGGRVRIVYDNYAVSLNESDGTVVGEREFQGTVQCCDFSSSRIDAVYLDSATNKRVMTIFDNDMTPLSSKAVSLNINRIAADGTNVYIVEAGVLYGFDSEGNIIAEKALVSDYVSFVKIGGAILLLGYDSVDIEYI